MTRDQVGTRTVYRVRAGSHAYGLNTETSDLDIRGICIPTENVIYGLGNFEQFEDKTNDIVIYDIRKFFKLALKCNPNIVELLYVRPSDIISWDRYGLQIISNRHLFLSQEARRTFGGYAISQLKKFVASAVPGGPEPNFKNAMHLIRLLKTGISILRDGEPEVYRAYDRDQLLAIRSGHYTVGQIESMAEMLFLELNECPSSLPEKADYEAANELLVSIVRTYLAKERI